MISLDMRTIIFIGTTTNVVCLLVIILMWQQNRQRFAGTTFLVVDFALQATAFFMIILRGIIPDWASIVLSNTMVIIGSLLGYMGLLRFTQKKSTQIHNYILLAAFVGVHCYLTFVQPNLAIRNLNTALGLLVICFQCLWLMLYRVGPKMRQLTRTVGIVFGMYCLLSIIRIGHTLAGTNSETDFMQSGLLDTLILASYHFLFILLTYSLVLMFNKRLIMDISTQEEKFTKAFQSSPDAFLITSVPDGRITEVNTGAIQLSGYSMEEMLGRTTTELGLWADPAARDAYMAEIQRKGRAANFETGFRIKSGAIIIGLISGEIIQLRDEKCFLSVIKDITERKQAEEALQESETRLSTIFKNDPTGIFIVNSKTQRIYDINDSALEAIGLSKGDVVGNICHKFLCPSEMGSCPICDLGQVVDRSERVLLKPDGTRVSILKTVVPITLKGENYLLESFIDITEPKQAEEALRESERRFRETVVNLDEGFYSVTLDGLLLECNNAFKRILGFDETTEMAGVTLPDFWQNPDERQEYLQVLKADGSVSNYQINVKTLAGDKIVVIASAHFVKDKDNRPLRIEGVFLDITKRIQAEEEIRLLNENLEKRVKKRTTQLKEINKELEAFSYSVSHDLRAPLRHINGYIDLLKRRFPESIPEKANHYLDSIEDSAKQMGHLIDDLLQFSRTGRQEMRLIDCDMNSMLEDVLDTIKKHSGARNINWIIPVLPNVLGDYNLLKLVWYNLLSNAVKFTRTKETTMIETGFRAEDKEYIFFVRDNGAGFDMQYAEKLFGVFQRLHDTEKYEGTGIGLANVRRIILRHGGRTWAEGETDKGATFYFSIPKNREVIQ